MPAALYKGRRASLAALLFSAVFSTTATAQSVERCAPCHGSDGNSAMPGVPSIAGQPRVFLENVLILMREGLRGSDAMKQAVKGDSDADIVALAAYFARLPARAAPREIDRALFERGRQVATKYRCGTCHLPDFSGREQIQRLAGQREDYLVEIMRTYRDDPPRGSDTLMSAALYGVSDADIRAMAHFLARTR